MDLTPDQQDESDEFLDCSSESLHEQIQSTFTFPVLRLDGSVEHIEDIAAPHQQSFRQSSGFTTPPAALSSLGARVNMVQNRSAPSISDEQYDMLDDISETSSDERETASLASTPAASDDEGDIETSEVDASLVEIVPSHELPSHSSELSPEDELLQSGYSEDLETPRQSVMAMPTVNLYKAGSTNRDGASPVKAKPAEDVAPSVPTPTFLRSSDLWFLNLGVLCLGVYVFYTALIAPLNEYLDRRYDAVNIISRRDALSTALFNFKNSSEFVSQFNLEHLVPTEREPRLGRPFDLVHHQGSLPNNIIISLLKPQQSQQFPVAGATKVYKLDGPELNFNMTMLIDGIYLLNIAQEDAYDIVWANMDIQDLGVVATAWHNFGERKSTSFAQAASKELLIVTNATKEWLAGPLSAGLMATKNVTTELATYVSRDLQVLGNTALSVIAKAAKQTNNTLAVLQKDLITVQKDFDVLKATMQRSMSTTMKSIKGLIPSTKRSLADSLSRSRSKARALRKRLQKTKAKKSRGPLGEQTAKLDKEISKTARKLKKLERKLVRESNSGCRSCNQRCGSGSRQCS